LVARSDEEGDDWAHEIIGKGHSWLCDLRVGKGKLGVVGILILLALLGSVWRSILRVLGLRHLNITGRLDRVLVLICRHDC